MCKRRPFRISHILGQQKYDLIEFGLDFEYFHCTDDNVHIRKRVFSILEQHIKHLRIDSIIVEKRKTGPGLREPKKFYPSMLGYLIRYVIKGTDLRDIDEVLVITDTIPIQKKRRAIEKAVKVTLRSMLPPTTKFRIMHHMSRSTYGLQIADYCNWAVFRKWERGDSLFYQKIRPGISSEFDIFRGGQLHYY